MLISTERKMETRRMLHYAFMAALTNVTEYIAILIRALHPAGDLHTTELHLSVLPLTSVSNVFWMPVPNTTFTQTAAQSVWNLTVLQVMCTSVDCR